MDLNELHQSLPEDPPEHFCLSPFVSIRQNAYGKNSPCAFGAGEWEHGALTPEERWCAPELNSLRQKFILGQKPSECHRCWAEEDAGKLSLRQRQFEYFPDAYQTFVRSGDWIKGPKTAVFKTSNVCNLACRSCGGWDSNTFAREGQHYLQVYDTKTADGRPHNRYVPRLPPKHMDFSQYWAIAENLEKIDFFGGEPLLNITQLDFLEYLANKGLSKNITLFYSTNVTNHPTDRLKRAWDKFKRVEISMSIDGIGDRFEYMRWPGKWDQALEVINHIKGLRDQLDCEIYTMAGFTISILNMLDADSVTDWLHREIGDIYVNMVESPEFLALHTVPDHVKSRVREKIQHPEVLGYIDIQPHDLQLWKQFMIWTKRMDLYRAQKFEKTFPELYELIRDEWDHLEDLSEKNFYQIVSFN